MAWDVPWLIIGLAVQLWVVVIGVACVMMVMRVRRVTWAYRTYSATGTPPGGNSRVTQELPPVIRPASPKPDNPVTLQISTEIDEDTRKIINREQDAIIRRHTQRKKPLVV